MSKVKNKSTKLTKAAIATAVVASSIPIVSAGVGATGFSDVSEKNSHAENIYDLYERGAIKGYEDGTFRPTQYVTRSQAAMIISKVLGLNTENVKDPGFSDVKKSSEAYPYIAALTQAGIISGSDGKFNPNGHLTRGQMAKILARAYNIEGDFEHVFKDVPEDHQYTKYVNGLAAAGITLGKEDGTYDMKSYVQRAQLASFVIRADQYKKDNEGSVIIGNVETIKENTITVDGHTYTIPKKVEFLTNASNSATLKNAQITFVTKNNAIDSVQRLELVEGSSFDGKDYTFEALVLHDGIKELKNVQAATLKHKLSETVTNYDNVIAKQLTTTAATKEIASLKAMAVAEQTAHFNLVNSKIDELTVAARAVEMKVNKATEIKNLHLPQATSIHLTGSFNTVHVAANAFIQGEGQLVRLVAPNNTVTVSPQFTVQEVEVGGKTLSWKEAVASKIVAQPEVLNEDTTNPGNGNNNGSNGEVGTSSSNGSNNDSSGNNSTGNTTNPGNENSNSSNSEVGAGSSNGSNNDSTDNNSNEPVKEDTETENTNNEFDADMGNNESENEDENQQPNSTNVDRAFVTEKTAEVNNLLQTISASNGVKKEDLEQALQSIEDVTVQIQDFNVVESTATAKGKVTATVVISKNDATSEVLFTKEIGINQEAKKQQIEQLLASFTVTNAITKQNLENELASILDETVQIKDFSIIKASTESTGSVTANIIISKGSVSETIVFEKAIPKLLQQVVDTVPTVNDDRTIVVNNEVRQVDKQTAKALVALQTFASSSEENFVQIDLVENANATVELAAVTVQPSTTVDSIDLATIPTTAQVNLVVDNAITIENLNNENKVVVEGNDNKILFTETEKMNEVELKDVQQVEGLNASNVVVTGNLNTEFVGVNTIGSLTIEETTRPVVAMFASLLPMSTFATTSTIKISLAADTSVEDLNISRTDTVVDVNKGATISKVNVKSNNTTIIANKIANVTIFDGVTNIILGDDTTSVTIDKLVVDLNHDVVISGNATITTLSINVLNSGKKVKLDSTVKVLTNENPEAIDNGSTHQLINGTKFGYYKLSDATNVAYTVQYQNTTANIPDTASGGVAYTTNGIKVDAMTQMIALYNAEKKYLGKVITTPSSRPKFSVSDIDANEGLLLLDTTFTKLDDLNKGLNHLIVFKHTDSPTGYQVTKLIEEIGSFPITTYKFKTYANSANVLNIPLTNISSLKYLVIKADDMVYDTVSNANKDERIKILKELAAIAKSQNDESIIYDYLKTIFAIEGKTYDSIFTPSIINTVLANDFTTISELVTFTDKKRSDIDYQAIVPSSDLYLNTNVTKVSGDGTYSEITVEGENLLIKAIGKGTEYVTFKDGSGAVSILEVVADNTATNAEDKIKTKLIKTEIDINAEILYGQARIVNDNGVLYFVPSSVNSNVVTYNAGADSATVGVFKSYKTNTTGVITATTITPLTVNKSDLNIAGTITRQQLGNSGFVTTDDAIHFYPTNEPTTSDQYTITVDGKSTAIAITNTAGTLDKKIATNIVSTNTTDSTKNLGMEQVKSIEPTTANTTMHTAITANTASIFASKANDLATFKVTAQDGKVALINAQSSTTGSIHLDNVNVVKSEQALTTGVTMIAPRTSAGALKEDVIRLVGNTIYATGAGTERIVLTDGTQLSVNIKHENNTYTMNVDTVTSAVVTKDDLHLQNISDVKVNGSSTTAVNVGNEIVSITAVTNTTGKSEVIVTDSEGKKVVLYVEVDANGLKDLDTVATGNQLYKVVRKEITATDLGFTTISSISQRTESARGINESNKFTIYGTTIGSTVFTVIGNDNKKSLLNVLVEKNTTTNELEVQEDVVKKTVNFVDVGLTSTATFDPLANGKDVVRIEGNTLYALKEGSVDLAIKDSPEKFYRISVVKNEATGLYSFTEPKLVVKSVYTASELGLSVIEAASSSNDNIASVEFTSDKITLTTQTVDGVGSITVTGPEGQTQVYVKKQGTTLITEIEDATTMLDVTDTGLANIKAGELVGIGAVRSQIVGSKVNFFALDGGASYYKVTDDNGLISVINLNVETNASDHREVVPTFVREEVGLKDVAGVITPQNGEIVSGTSIRLHTSNGKQYAYAVSTGDTVVKLADNTLVKYSVEIEDGLVKLTSDKITNGVAINDTALDLSGNLSIVSAPDSLLVTAVAKGKQIIFTGHATDGESSIVVTDGIRTIRAKVVIEDGVLTVTTMKYTVTDGTLTKIHTAKTNARISADGKTIYAVDAGTFEFIEEVGSTKTVKQLSLTNELTKYTLPTPTELRSVIYNADVLGLTNAIEVTTGFNNEVLSAGMVGSDFVAYQKATGNTDVLVKDGKGQSTLLHFVSDISTAFTAHIAKEDEPFIAADFDLDKIESIDIANKAIAEMHEDGDFYLLSQGTTYATLTDENGKKAIATIKVTKVDGKLEAEITPVSKTAALLAVGATTVNALPGALTDSAIVRVSNNKVYAVGKGTTQVKLNGQIVNITVNEEGTTYSITAGALVNFIELDLGEGTYTVADVTNTNAVKVVEDDNGTAQDKTDDKLLIYVTANNGLADLTITDDTQVKVVHHIKVENGVITNPPAKAIVDVTSEVSELTLANPANKAVQINDTKLHLLRPGTATLNGTDGLVNVKVTRNETTNYLQARQTVVEKEIKEAITADTAYTVKTKDGKTYLRPLAPSTQKVYYTDNYRIATTTVLNNDVYELEVEERHMKEVAYGDYGLSHSTDHPITLQSEKEDIAKAEMTADGKLLIYAGAGVTEPSGTTKITATDNDGKKITINVTRSDSGEISYTVAGQVDAIKFVDLGIDPTNSTMTVTDYKTDYVQATVSSTGISLAAQSNGTTSMLIKKDGTVVAIVNINVTDGNAVTDVVKYDATDFSDVITGDNRFVRIHNGQAYATTTGTALYQKGNNKAIQLKVAKTTDTGLYSISPTSYDLVVGAENLDIAVDDTTTLNIANSSVAEAFIKNNKLYIVAKSLGSTDILVTNGTDKAIVHAHAKATGITAKVAAHTPIITGAYAGNNSIQVRGNKLYALTTGKSIIKLDNTLVTANVTRNMDTNEFDIVLSRVEHTFTGANSVALVDTNNTNIVVADKTIYVKAVGTAQLYVDDKVVDVVVVENTDGTFKINVKEMLEQVVLTGEDLGLTLSNTTTVTNRAITGSNVVRTEVVNGQLVIFALGTGSAELVVDGQTVVHVQISASNNKLIIATPTVAKEKVVTSGTVTELENGANIRLHPVTGGYEVYALAEGTSLVTDTTDTKKSLYKVVATRNNNALKVSTSLVATKLTDLDATIIDNSVVRGTSDGRIIATGVGTQEFIFADTTYRVTVTTTGEMTVEVLATQEIDLSSVITSISGTPASSFATLTPITGTAKMTVTAQKIGTEIVKVTDGANTILLKLEITEDPTDANKKNVAYEIIKSIISTTGLGFHPKMVSPITNGLVQIEDSNVVVYPGITSGKEYFTVTGDGNTQAIYSLTIDANEVKLNGNAVNGYTVEPLNTSVAISDLGFNPTVVAIDGTAKASINEATQKIDIVLNNTEKSYIIIKGEDDVYKTIEVQANATDLEVKVVVHDALKLDTVTEETLNGPIRSVTDNEKSIIYATDSGNISYKNNGKLYNSVVLKNNDTYTFDTAEEITVPVNNAALVNGQMNVVKNDDNSYSAVATGSADYRTDGGYKQVDVEVVNNHYTAIVNNLFSTSLPSTIDTATIVKAPNSVKVDGKTIYGGVNATDASLTDVGEVIVVKTVTGEGVNAKVTVYTATIEADGTGVKYAFTPVTRDILQEIGWLNTTSLSSVTASDSSIVRIENGILYFLRSGNVSVIVTSSTGLKHILEYSIDEDFVVTLVTNTNVINYQVEQIPVFGETELRFTFDLNVMLKDEVAAALGEDFFITATANTAIKSSNNRLIVNAENSIDSLPLTFKMYLPEYGVKLNEFKINFNPNDLSTISVNSNDPNLKFNFIQ